MRFLLVFVAALALACCDSGGGANAVKQTNTANDGAHEHVHDHFHSHAGDTHKLGTVESGGVTFTAWLKDRVKRGELTVVELKVEGREANAGQLGGAVMDSRGGKVVDVGAFHPMKEAGRFGVHLILPKGAPHGLTVRFTLAEGEFSTSADFALEE